MPAERLRLWLERADRGFFLRDAETNEPVRWEDERLAAAGVRVVPVAGVSYRADALQDEAFAPGRTLVLLHEPENEHDPNAIAVWDEGCRVKVGYVPAELARALTLPLQAVSLWESRDADRRIGLRILIAPPEVWLGRPRSSAGGLPDQSVDRV